MNTGEFVCDSVSGFEKDGVWHLNWSSNLGFGTLTIGFDEKRVKWWVGNEHMSKEWVAAILARFVIDMTYLTDVVDETGTPGEWVSVEEELPEEEANRVFADILKKGKYSRVFDVVNNEERMIADTFKKDGEEDILYTVISSFDQNTTTDLGERWIDIDTYSLGAEQTPISVLTGFTTISKKIWKIQATPNRYLRIDNGI